MTLINNKIYSKDKRRYLRNNATYVERTLWQYLKGKKLKGYKFRRQHGLGLYIVDFYCPQAKLVIEIDGDSHYTDASIMYDKKRQRYIESLGIKIIRFTNDEVRDNLSEVLDIINNQLS